MMVSCPSNVRLFICCAIFIVWRGAACADSVVESSYASLLDDNCFQPSGDTLYHYAKNDLGVVECRVKNKEIRLFVVSSQERSWIDIAVGDMLWSTEDSIVYSSENQFGNFPNVGSTPVELVVNKKQVLVGFIFRVTAEDRDREDQSSAKISRLFVFGFRKEGACFLGLTDDNSAARSFLQKGVNCRQQLKSSNLVDMGRK